MEMYLSVNKKINFTQMARFGRSCESRFRQNFRKAFDWIGFNRSFLKPASGNLVTLAIDMLHQQGGKGSDVVQRFISMSVCRPYLHLNHNDFKELLFYGVRAAV